MIRKVLCAIAFLSIASTANAASPAHLWVYSGEKPATDAPAPSQQFYAYSTITTAEPSKDGDSQGTTATVEVHEGDKVEKRSYELYCERNGGAYDETRKILASPEREVAIGNVEPSHRDIVNAWFAVCKHVNNRVKASSPKKSPPNPKEPLDPPEKSSYNKRTNNEGTQPCRGCSTSTRFPLAKALRQSLSPSLKKTTLTTLTITPRSSTVASMGICSSSPCTTNNVTKRGPI